jgi:hypothetical protein
MASGNDLESDVIAFYINTGMLRQKGARTIARPITTSNPSLNSTPGCLKVVDTFRTASAGRWRGGRPGGRPGGRLGGRRLARLDATDRAYCVRPVLHKARGGRWRMSGNNWQVHIANGSYNWIAPTLDHSVLQGPRKLLLQLHARHLIPCRWLGLLGQCCPGSQRGRRGGPADSRNKRHEIPPNTPAITFARRFRATILRAGFMVSTFRSSTCRCCTRRPRGLAPQAARHMRMRSTKPLIAGDGV